MCIHGHRNSGCLGSGGKIGCYFWNIFCCCVQIQMISRLEEENRHYLLKGKRAGLQYTDYYLVSHLTEMKVSKPGFPMYSKRTFIFYLQLPNTVKDTGLVQNRVLVLKKLLILCVCGRSLVWAVFLSQCPLNVDTSSGDLFVQTSPICTKEVRTILGVSTCCLSCLRWPILFMLCMPGQLSYQFLGVVLSPSCWRSTGISGTLHTQLSPSPEQLFILFVNMAQK